MQDVCWRGVMRSSSTGAGSGGSSPSEDDGGGGGGDTMSAIGVTRSYYFPLTCRSSHLHHHHRTTSLLSSSTAHNQTSSSPNATISPKYSAAKRSNLHARYSSERYNRALRYITVYLLSLVLASASATVLMGEPSHDSLFVVERFVDDEGQSFQHIAVDKSTGAVYAAGVNKLYQLDPDLNLLQTVETGPVDDAPDCSATGCAAENRKSMKPTNNINKVLLLDYLRARVIVCGTVRQGSCQVRDLRNITILTRNVSEPIAANNASASTVAFIAPGPPKFPVSHVLYIGVTYSGQSAYRHEVPAVASRSLEDDHFFEIAVTEVTTSTRMLVNNYHRPSFPITYVYGFGSGKFSYFLTRQRSGVNADAPYVSKLVRICQNDSAYYSYTEVPLKCRDSNGNDYNLVQAAYVGKAGNELSSQLGIQIKDDVLFAVFSPSDPTKGAGSDYPTSESALCVYSLKNIQTKFIHNIQECFRGNGNRGLDFISTSHGCIATVSISLSLLKTSYFY